MKRRNFILLLGGASSGAMSVGTGAFSSMEADRGVEVSVVEDDSAYVGYDTSADEEGEPVTVENGERITLVDISNRFTNDTEIGVVLVEVNGDAADVLEDLQIRTVPSDQSGADEETIDVSGSEYATEEPTVTFSTAGYAKVTALVEGIDTDPRDIEVTIGVKGTGVAAQLFGDTRAFAIEGAEDDTNVEPEVPEFAGNGNVFLDPEGVIVEVLALYGEATGESDDTRVEPSSEDAITWNTSEHNQFKNAKPDDEDDFDPSNKLLAVYFVDRGLVYYNPEHDEDEIGFPDDWPEPKRGETR